MTSLCFFHAADLHLGAPFKGLEAQAPQLATRLHEAAFTALCRLTELCIARKADFLLLAGDIYNHEEGSLKAQFALRDACVRLEQAGIFVFMVHGNHDCASSCVTHMEWPSNVTIFNAETVEAVPVVRQGHEIALIHGISHASPEEHDNLAQRFRRDKTRDHLPQIGLLHCSTTSVAAADRYAPCSVDDLRSSALDYWALGHVHQRQDVCKTPLCVYPGNTQGLHINETGLRGCYEIRHDGSAFVPHFHQLGPVVWEKLDISIDGVKTMDALEAHIHDAVVQRKDAIVSRTGQAGGVELTSDIILRVTLTGRGELSRTIRDLEGVADLMDRVRHNLSDMAPGIWINDIVPACRPQVDMDTLRAADTLLGETLRRVYEAKSALCAAEAPDDNTEAICAELVQGPLRPLFLHPSAGRLLARPDPKQLCTLLDAVELTCLELLEER